MLAGCERRKAPGGSRLAAAALRYRTTAAEHRAARHIGCACQGARDAVRSQRIQDSCCYPCVTVSHRRCDPMGTAASDKHRAEDEAVPPQTTRG